MDLSRGLMAARTLRLNGRTLHRTVGAEHATVTRVPALSLGHNKTSALHQAGPGYRIHVGRSGPVAPGDLHLISSICNVVRLFGRIVGVIVVAVRRVPWGRGGLSWQEIGRASCRERG